MALSDILKKYSEEAREGIMAKDPELDKGIMPYKTSKATTPVYNLDTDTVTERVSVNFEPSGLMKATEGIVPYQTKDLFEQPTMPEGTTTGIMGTMPQATTQPVTEEAPFMPDMGLPIPTPEPVEAQPFITGPTSVISYGTTEEGTPRLLTNITTGETVYADTGQPYTPPSIDDGVDVDVGEDEEIPSCQSGYVYDPVLKQCVPIQITPEDNNKPEEFLNKPRDVGPLAKATTQITDVLTQRDEQGNFINMPAYGEDFNATIDNSSFLSNFGIVGNLVDKLLIKGPADAALNELGASTEGINVSKNDDGTLQVNITEQGKINFGKVQTQESLKGNLASTQKTDSKGNIIKAPNGQNMIWGPIQVNTFGKTTDAFVGMTDKEREEQIAKNKAIADKKQAEKDKIKEQGFTNIPTSAPKSISGEGLLGGGPGNIKDERDDAKSFKEKYGAEKTDKEIKESTKKIENDLDKLLEENEKQNKKDSGGGGGNSGGGGGGKIVCTEMYRQTQLEDWARAMKIWDIYQKRYLTPLHEKGYHWLFRPYVEGMKKNNMMTRLGAYLAKERTQHLKHILTKGKAKDSFVGNIWCKIIHPIVYVAGKIKKQKGDK